jgi:hypothetical protein
MPGCRPVTSRVRPLDARFSADWQIVPADGTSVGDVRYTLRAIPHGVVDRERGAVAGLGQPGVFVGVGARTADGVVYEIYLVA